MKWTADFHLLLNRDHFCFVHPIFSSFGFWYFGHFSCVIFFPFFSVSPILPCKIFHKFFTKSDQKLKTKNEMNETFKSPKQNQNKSKFLKLLLSGKALEFSQCFLVWMYFETIWVKLIVFDKKKSQIDYIYFFVHNQKVGRQKCYVNCKVNLIVKVRFVHWISIVVVSNGLKKNRSWLISKKKICSLYSNGIKTKRNRKLDAIWP